MTPRLEAVRFLHACVIGLGLGVWYGVLRPLRQRHPVAGDLLFLPVLGYGWLYLGFAVCRGDLRSGYCAGLLIGIVVWEASLGWLLRPVFRGVYRALRAFFRLCTRLLKNFFKKTQKIAKFLFARREKSVTIVNAKLHGGGNHGKKKPAG